MTEGGLLHTPACLVGHRVGQPAGVEVVLHNTVAWPSGATRALAYPRQGSSATVPTWASQSRGRI